jgi:hypothetical protein
MRCRWRRSFQENRAGRSAADPAQVSSA